MNSKERVHAALEGRSVDRLPVTVSYHQLFCLDHFAELTGRPQWEVNKWLYASQEEHTETFAEMIEKAPFDILQPQRAAFREERENTEFVERNGVRYKHDRRTDGLMPIDEVGGRADENNHYNTAANETQYVFYEADANERIKIPSGDELQRTGENDFLEAVVERFGGSQFILSAGVVGTVYACHEYVGLTNLFAMMIEAPELIDHMCKRLRDRNIETIRYIASAGGDAIFIDDATATCDMISVKHYERFSLPYMREMVKEIHALGHKAILIYFGGVSDRLEQIASIGADGFLFEASMKGYVNDVSNIARRIGDRVTPYANIDPVGVLQDGTEEDLEAEMKKHILAGRNARGFVVSTASPVTPATPLSRVRRFIELAHLYGAWWRSRRV